MKRFIDEDLPTQLKLVIALNNDKLLKLNNSYALSNGEIVKIGKGEKWIKTPSIHRLGVYSVES